MERIEIEKLANDSFESNTSDEGLFPNHTDKDIWIVGFVEGFLLKNFWVKVKDKLPLAFETGDWDGKRSALILIKNKYNDIYLGRFYTGILDGSEFKDFVDVNDSILDDVIEWKNI